VTAEVVEMGPGPGYCIDFGSNIFVLDGLIKSSHYDALIRTGIP
jgi:hypothetical protein